jgi:hypothetical protein
VPAAAFLLLAVFGVVLSPLPLGMPHGPTDASPWMAFGLMLGGSLLGVLFWGMIVRRLTRSILGEEVPHLMPRWLAVVFALFLGVAGLALTALALMGKAPPTTYGSVGASVTFLGFAVRQIRGVSRW